MSHPKFKATWVAFAAGSLAGLAVLGACSDNTVGPIAGPKAPNAPVFGVVGGTAHLVQVCVDVASDPSNAVGGKYTFNIAAMDPTQPPYPWYELKTSSDPDLSIYGITQNSTGPFNASTDNDVITPVLSLAPGECGTGLQRANTCPGGVCGADPFDHGGNRLWTDATGTTNPYATVTITGNTPAGFTLASLGCVNDDTGNPISCVDGGYGAQNVFHGSTFTYKYDAPDVTPCPAGLFTWEIADGVGEEKWPAGNVGDILVRYDQFPAPNDNSYGVNAVGWDGGHTFGNLVGSDKAGVQVKNSSGTVVLSFNIDYISQKAGTPSGYASLGVTDGEGDMLVGTSAGILATTSLANNLNTTGYCVAGNCTVAGTNLLVNSPPTDAAHQTYVLANPAAHGLWDFHNTYYARISPSNPALAGFNASTWTVEPNLTVLHNSPDKECPAGPFNCADITVGTKTFKDKEVKIDVNNINASQDAFVTGVHITWPSGTNGALKSIKVGGDVIWTGTINGGTANLVLADLATDANKRKIGKNNDEDLKFIFANNASTNLAGYTASLDFGDTCNKPILP